MQVLYVDTLLFANLAMNYLSFGLTARLLHHPLGFWRRFLSAFLGGVYAVVSVVFSFPLVLHIPVLLLLSVLLLRIAFGKMGGGSLFLGSYFVFCVSNFLLGGAAEWLFGYMEEAFGTRNYFGLRSSDIALFACFLAYLILKLMLRFFAGTPVPNGASVRFALGNRSLTLPLLVDSGCLLSDPISGKAALLVGVDAMEGFLPKEMFLYLKGRTHALPDNSFLEKRIRLLPSESIGGKKLLTALRLDGVYLITADKKEVALDVLVAFSEDTQEFGGYKGVMPANVYLSKNDIKARRNLK